MTLGLAAGIACGGGVSRPAQTKLSPSATATVSATATSSTRVVEAPRPPEPAPTPAQACNNGAARACLKLALEAAPDYRTGHLSKEAAALFLKTCVDGGEPTCSEWAQRLVGVTYGKMLPDHNRFLETSDQMYALACGLGNGRGCYEAGNNSIMADTPKSVAEHWLSLLERGCALEHKMSCFLAARAHDDGRGVTISETTANRFYERGCKLGNNFSCSSMARRFERGTGVAKDLVRAFKMTLALCENPRAGANQCTQVARYYRDGVGVAVDEVKAHEFFERGCANSDPNACFSLSKRYDKGIGVAKDVGKGTEYMAVGCEMGAMWPLCLDAAKRYRQGVGVPPNPARAKELTDHACATGGPCPR